MTLTFFLNINPRQATHQQKKFTGIGGRIIAYEPQRLKDARALFMAALAKFRPRQPMRGALQLKTVWCYKARTKKQVGTYKTTRPDTDNMIKLLKDCMAQSGYFVDDSQIAIEITEKRWNDVQGIFVELRQIEELSV